LGHPDRELTLLAERLLERLTNLRRLAALWREHGHLAWSRADPRRKASGHSGGRLLMKCPQVL
jgi:hypothetical protein